MPVQHLHEWWSLLWKPFEFHLSMSFWVQVNISQGFLHFNLLEDFFFFAFLSFSGTFCEIESDECHSNPCLNGATCVDEFNSYFCLCKPGFSGVHCETPTNQCNNKNRILSVLK